MSVLRLFLRQPLVWIGLLCLAIALGCSNPGCGPTPEEAERESVESSVYNSDTLVTYADGTPFGALFQDEHRLVAEWEEIPPAWVIAIVAAEDGRFWSHGGVDAQGVARAAGENVVAGSVVAGGSTLTQQTAKNLFERPGRTLSAKWQELDYAYHLEDVFEKHEILLLYANLFHVTGNGSGIGVAARYFFDKTPEELTVLESAYLAGLVKGPANYDPFPGNAKRRAQNLKRAHDRTRYVLSRMVEEEEDALVPPASAGIGPDAVAKVRKRAQKLLDEGFEIPFRRGYFRYDASVLTDEVARRLSTPFFKAVLDAAGIEDPASEGLTIVTTLEEPVQRASVYGLWHHLTEIGVMLEKLGPEAFITDRKPPSDDGAPRLYEFRDAVVTRHVDNYIEADLGGHLCNIDRSAIVRAAAAVYRGQREDRWAKVPTKEVDGVLAAIPDGAVVWVSVRDVSAKGVPLCDLELRPELQGAVIVLEEGQIRAMVGGSTNRDFDRVRAHRQFGSTFKPLIYHAAMTLGWRPDDILDNRRNVFTYSGTEYAPRPDHDPAPDVSMTWAGVKSENLASIWLLYHLVDRLTPEQIAELAATLDLAQLPDEDDKAYRTRIQEAGVMSTKSRLPEIHFASARQQVVASLIAEVRQDEARLLESLTYGAGAASGDSWQVLKGKLEPCRENFKALKKALRKDDPIAMRDFWVRQEGEDVQLACGDRPEGFDPVSTLASTKPKPPPAPEPAPDAARDDTKTGKGRKAKRGRRNRGADEDKTKTKAKAQAEEEIERSDLPDVTDILVDGRLTLGTLETVAQALERQSLVFETGDQNLYSMEVLQGHQDFRVLLAIKYVQQLARRYGIQTELAPVLSMPLGATEITLEEAALLYSGLVSGEAVLPDIDEETGPTTLIAEIRDVDGTVLYKATTTSNAVADRDVGQMTADILRNVVLHGTGRSAKGAATYDGAAVPIGGKTGTTNDYRNAAFLGYVPGATTDGFTAHGGHTVAAYVGYDDNRAMKVGRIRISGAGGALPPWIAAVKAINVTADWKVGAEPSGEEWPLLHSDELVWREVIEGPSVLTRPPRTSAVVAPAEVAKVDRKAQKVGKARRGRKRNEDKEWWQFWQ